MSTKTNIQQHWSLFCNTENTAIQVYSDTKPVYCPNGKTHVLNKALTVLLDKIFEPVVKLKEQDYSTLTGGHVLVEAVTLNVNAGPDVSTSKTITWDIPHVVTNIQLCISASNFGDAIQVITYPMSPAGITSLGVPVGIVNADIVQGTNNISVSDSVIDNVFVGMLLKVSQTIGTNTVVIDLGHIVSIDIPGRNITISNNSTGAMNVADSLITVFFGVKSLDIQEIPEATGTIRLGDTVTGGMTVPPGSQTIITYTNKTSSTKKFTTIIESMY